MALTAESLRSLTVGIASEQAAKEIDGKLDNALNLNPTFTTVNVTDSYKVNGVQIATAAVPVDYALSLTALSGTLPTPNPALQIGSADLGMNATETLEFAVTMIEKYNALVNALVSQGIISLLQG